MLVKSHCKGMSLQGNGHSNRATLLKTEFNQGLIRFSISVLINLSAETLININNRGSILNHTIQIIYKNSKILTTESHHTL
jgi:hypothetical protein